MAARILASTVTLERLNIFSSTPILTQSHKGPKPSPVLTQGNSALPRVVT
uniref:Uncharacterized protein n=1 Tax=Rhizophora mucronata TaxID=61149 RepID=A0A2P2N0F7_RHIMU